MIPIRDIIPSRTTPFVTVSLIAVNLAVFAYEWSLGPALQPFLLTHGLIPAEFAWFSVFTSMFLHGGLFHVGGNMLYLWIFGDNVEDRVGHGRFLLFYLACGTVAALAQTWVTPVSRIPMVGASGAVAGVMGAYLVLYPRSRIVTLIPIIIIFKVIEIPAMAFLGIWFLMQFINGLGTAALSPAGQAGGGIAFWAHVAGFAAGAAGIFAARRPERARVEWWDDVSR